MSYTPTVWKSGDVVTSEKLNKLEEGVAASDSVLMVTIGESNGSLAFNHTAGEIMSAALLSGKLVVFMLMEGNDPRNPVISFGRLTKINAYSEGNTDTFRFSVLMMDGNSADTWDFAAESEDSYPQMVISGGD